jgi:hypothetical protein
MHDVGYVVHSSSKATITYTSQKGKSITVLADTVWHFDFLSDQDGNKVSLKATDSAGGPIRAVIWMDAEVVGQQQASGSVEISAIIPEKGMFTQRRHSESPDSLSVSLAWIGVWQGSGMAGGISRPAAF